jgi:hypothetical protein
MLENATMGSGDDEIFTKRHETSKVCNDIRWKVVKLSTEIVKESPKERLWWHEKIPCLCER